MIRQIIYMTCFLCILPGSQSQENISSTQEPSKNCRERNRLIATEKRDLYTVIDATLGQKLILQCHYCTENDDNRPKNWYKVDELGISKPHAVKLTMNNDNQLNRVRVNSEHSLIIHNFNQSDCGLYYCVGYEEQNNDEKYNYLVDSFESGDIAAWTQYFEDYLIPVNTLFLESLGEEFVIIRSQLNLKMQLMTKWDPWGICDVCGRPKGEGVKKKKGYCQIKITQYSSTQNITAHTEKYAYFLSATKISCKSKRLYDAFPEIGNITRVIPNFVQAEPCEGICNPDAEGVNAGWKVGKTKKFKYRKTFVLAEGAHLSIVCPESTLDNVVVWKKNSKVLKAGEGVEPQNPKDEPRIMVDTFNTLYLVNVKSTEEGNYTCQVDDIRMQQVIVFIVSKARILTQAFLRHLMYLGFVLSLTITCYCAGLIIAIQKRYTFKTYEEIRKEEKKRNKHRGEFKNLI